MFVFMVVGFGMLLNVYRFGTWLGSGTAIMVAAICILLSPLLQKFWFSVFVTGFNSRNVEMNASTTLQRYWQIYTTNNVHVTYLMIRTSLLSSISIMVVMTSLVGRINIYQLIKFTSLYQVFWPLNYYLLIWFLAIKNDFNSNTLNPFFFDMFGTTYVYLFAVCYGLPFLFILRRSGKHHRHKQLEMAD
jgi:hypothetical protein